MPMDACSSIPRYAGPSDVQRFAAMGGARCARIIASRSIRSAYVAEHISRKELKTDKIHDAIEHGAEAVYSHKQVTLIVVLLILVIALGYGGGGVFHHRKTAAGSAGGYQNKKEKFGWGGGAAPGGAG